MTLRSAMLMTTPETFTLRDILLRLVWVALMVVSFLGLTTLLELFSR